MKQLLLLALLAFAFNASSYGQTVLIEEYVDSITPLNGGDKSSYYNQSSFFAYHMGIGFAINPNEMAERNGIAWNYGFFYKQKLSNVFSLVADARISSSSNNYSLLEDNVQEIEFSRRRSKWLVGELGFGPRFNFDPNRGDKMGLYLTTEAFVGYVIDRRIKERYTLPGTEGVKQSSRIVGFATNTNLTYGVSGCIGYNNHAIRIQYRLSELVGTSNAGVLQGYELMEVSPLLITYQLGFF